MADIYELMLNVFDDKRLKKRANLSFTSLKKQVDYPSIYNI